VKLSKDFTFEELTATAHVDLMLLNKVEAASCLWSLRKVANDLLQPIRDGLDRAVIVTSGYRGETLNKRVGGSMRSQHCLGQAADFNVRGLTEREDQLRVCKWVLDNNIRFGQLLLERGCIHISLPRGWRDGEVAEYDVQTKSKKTLDLSQIDLTPIVKKENA
jgi:zinc D-Ala-D-Ala carboxypeptidase